MINIQSNPIPKSSNKKLAIFKDWSLGWIDKYPSFGIPDTAISDGQNMYYKEGNVLTTSFGFNKYNSSAIASSSGIRGLFGFYSTNRWLIIGSGTKLYHGNSGVPAGITGATGYTDNAEWSAAQFDTALYLVNGTDKVKITEAGGNLTAAAATNVPAGTMVVEHRNILFVAGVSGFPNRVYFSPIGDADGAWSGTGYVDVVSDDGDPVTCIIPFKRELIIFKKNSAYALSGASSDTFFLERISTEYGCAGIRAATVIGDAIALLDSKGPRAIIMDESYNFYDISTDRIPNALINLNDTYINKSCVSFYKNMIFFNVPDGSATSNSHRLVYDVDRKAWCPKWVNGFSCEVYYDAGTSHIYYSGNPTAGTVYTQNTDDKYDATAIEAWFRTKDYDFGMPFNEKSFSKMWLLANISGSATNRTITTTVYINSDSAKVVDFTYEMGSGGVWDTMTWDNFIWASDVNIESQKESISSRGKRIGFKFYNNTSDQEFTIYAVELMHRDRPIR